MERLTLLLVLVSFVLNVNARAFENLVSGSSESDEVNIIFNLTQKRILNKFL
jgi:flagellar biosynthesis/type III secretory pathway M-ring protein FliF/YscJ